MKKKLIVGGISALLLLPIIAGAAGIWSQNQFVLSKGQTRQGNMYVVAQEGFVDGAVRGDLVMVGGNLAISGDVSEDVLLGAGHAQISGTVGGDLRDVAGETILSGAVGGDVVVAGGKIYIADGSAVGGDLLVFGGQTIVEGAISGRVHVTGGEVTINGPISGNVEIQGGKLMVGGRAVISGNLRYRGPQAPVINPGASIKGKIEFVADDFGGNQFRYFANGIGILAAAGGILINLVLALLFFGCFKKRAVSLTHEAITGFWRNVGRGVLMVIVVPVVSVILLMTIVGLPVGIFGLLLLGIGNILAMAISGAIFGTWVMRTIVKRGDHQPTTMTVIWGTVALRVITLIPVIGWVIGAIFCAAAFGVLAAAAYRSYWLAR